MNSRTGRRNYFLGVLNGTFIRAYYSCLHGNTVLPVFVSNLTASNVLIGLSSALTRVGETLPRIVIANLVENQPQKKPVYLMMAWVRILTLALLAGIVFWTNPEYRKFLLFSFFAIFSIHSLAAGISGIPFTDIVGKMTPSPLRGSFFSDRYLYGGALSVLLGILVIRPVLSHYPFPRRYGIVFFSGVIFLTLALIAFSLVKEPIHPVRSKRRRFRQYLKAGLKLLKTDRNYSLLLLIEFLYGFSRMATPFYIIFARKVTGMPEAIAGTFLSASYLGFVITNLVWGRLSRWGGSRTVTQTALALAMLPPVIALASARFHLFHPVFFIILFFVNGAKISGYGVGRQSYLLDIAPGVDRPAYISFFHTLALPAMFFPALGGAIINLSSFEFLFVMAVFTAAIPSLLSLKLKKEIRG